MDDSNKKIHPRPSTLQSLATLQEWWTGNLGSCCSFLESCQRPRQFSLRKKTQLPLWVPSSWRIRGMTDIFTCMYTVKWLLHVSGKFYNVQKTNSINGFSWQVFVNHGLPAFQKKQKFTEGTKIRGGPVGRVFCSLSWICIRWSFTDWDPMGFITIVQHHFGRIVFALFPNILL